LDFIFCLYVNFKFHQIIIFDSCGNGINYKPEVEIIKKFTIDSSKLVSEKNYNLDFTWDEYYPNDIPHQINNVDCGVFVCQFAAYKLHNQKLNFSFKDIEFLRKKMLIEIINIKSKNLK
jgi:Ulp1 family protease